MSLLVALFMFSASHAQADDAVPVTNQSVYSESKNTFHLGLDQLYSSFFTNFHGTPVSKLDSAYTPSKNGFSQNSLGMYFDSTFVTAYRITKDIGFGPEVNFWYSPVQGREFTMQDSGVRLFKNHLITTENMNISGTVSFQLPTSDISRNRGQAFGVKFTPAIRYRLAKTPVTIGAWTEEKYYIGVDSGKTFKLWTEPYVNYDFNDTFGLTIGYEMESQHMLNNPLLSFDNVNTDLQPGVRWWITRKILFSPYVNLYTGNKITKNNSYLGAIVSLALL